jgi:hypothetical protein
MAPFDIILVKMVTANLIFHQKKTGVDFKGVEVNRLNFLMCGNKSRGSFKKYTFRSLLHWKVQK